jgi:3-oxoadipate enol-lactonase / 4-carboxymuconolactone decarboxylase
MSFVRQDSRVLHFELRPSASGAGSPPLLFIHALGTNLRIWDDVVTALRFPGPVLRFDLGGHGSSEVGDTPYDVAALARDALALLDHLRIEAAVVCGLSIGGLVAQELALTAPGRVRALILCGTAARIGTREGWQSRADQVRAGGLAAISDAVMARWFTPGFREREPDQVRGYRGLLERTPREGYLAAVQALADADLRGRVPALRVPALVITGEHDEATPPSDGRALASLIPGACFELLAGASHIPSIEKPRELAELIDAFLERGAAEGWAAGTASSPRTGAEPSSDPYERGMAVRRAVLGAPHVERALSAANDFDRDFQAYITRAAWGEVWARPGLPRHTRHLLTIAMLAALDRQEELAMHVRATVNTGVTPAELREALLQVAVYAGVPAANGAIKTAKRVLSEIDSEQSA